MMSNWEHIKYHVIKIKWQAIRKLPQRASSFDIRFIWWHRVTVWPRRRGYMDIVDDMNGSQPQRSVFNLTFFFSVFLEAFVICQFDCQSVYVGIVCFWSFSKLGSGKVEVSESSMHFQGQQTGSFPNGSLRLFCVAFMFAVFGHSPALCAAVPA